MLFPAAALADLYRWVDPETGSVKFSNVAPVGVRVKVERIPAAPAPRAPAEPKADELRRALEAAAARRK